MDHLLSDRMWEFEMIAQGRPPIDAEFEELLKTAQIGEALRGAWQRAREVGGALGPGLQDELMRMGARARGAAHGGLAGGLGGAAAGGIQAYLNPVQENILQRAGRYLFGGVDPTTWQARLGHIGRGAAHTGMRGAGIGSAIGAGVLGPAYAQMERTGRAARAARGLGVPPGRAQEFAREATGGGFGQQDLKDLLYQAAMRAREYTMGGGLGG